MFLTSLAYVAHHPSTSDPVDLAFVAGFFTGLPAAIVFGYSGRYGRRHNRRCARLEAEERWSAQE